jgi:hypothetical protein
MVILIKNWLHDPTIGFRAKREPENVDEVGEAEEEILDFLDVEFLDEVEDYVEDVCRIETCIHDFGSVFVHSTHGTFLVLIKLLSLIVILMNVPIL